MKMMTLLQTDRIKTKMKLRGLAIIIFVKNICNFFDIIFAAK